MSEAAEPVPFAVTKYGFKWGAMEVTRVSEIDGQVCISVRTEAGRRIDIYASKKGRSLRAFQYGPRGEMKVSSPQADVAPCGEDAPSALSRDTATAEGVSKLPADAGGSS